MLGSQFIEQYGRKGLPAWEAAALEHAREGALTPWPFVDLTLTDGSNVVVLKVQSDVLSIGPFEDHVRLPLTPITAQSIANLSGSLLPTPWLEYQIWKAATLKLPPTAMVPNQGANLEQYAQHSKLIDTQVSNEQSRLSSSGLRPDTPEARIRASLAPDAHPLVVGAKKGVVVANFYKPGKVLIFGWYRPPPAPDIFDDGKPMTDPKRQPIQPKSNVHGDFYVDYSHGIRLIGGIALVNGVPTDTANVYQSPTLWRLVNQDAGGPLKTPRYPSTVPVAIVRPAGDGTLGPAASLEVPRASTTPSISDYALDEIARQRRNKEET